MRKNNDFNIFKSQKKNPRSLKVAQLIKKTLGEVFLNLDFIDSEGESVLIFIEDVSLSKDTKIATVFVKNFSNKNFKSDDQVKGLIDKNLGRIKKDFSSKIKLRYTPKLKFKLDNISKKSFNLDEALYNLKKENIKNEK